MKTGQKLYNMMSLSTTTLKWMEFLNKKYKINFRRWIFKKWKSNSTNQISSSQITHLYMYNSSSRTCIPKTIQIINLLHLQHRVIITVIINFTHNNFLQTISSLPSKRECLVTSLWTRFKIRCTGHHLVWEDQISQYGDILQLIILKMNLYGVQPNNLFHYIAKSSNYY